MAWLPFQKMIHKFSTASFQPEPVEALYEVNQCVNSPPIQNKIVSLFFQLLLFDNFSAVDVDNFRDFGPILAGLWADPGIRTAFERRSEYQLTDSVSYFYTHLDRVSSPNYVPTQQVQIQ